MATAMISGNDPSIIFPREAYSVWVKPTWAAEWEVVPFLFPDVSVHACAPTEEEATFTWDYGDYLTLWYDQPGNTLTPLNLQNQYISILVHSVHGTYISWVGIVSDETIDDEGLNEQTGYPRGVQTLRAKGLAYLLKRRRVLGSFVSDQAGGYFEIPKTQVFNRRHGQGQYLLGNRSTDFDVNASSYLFAMDGERWSNIDILQYTLAHFQPLEPAFVVFGQYDALNEVYQEYDPHGKDVAEVFEDLLDRRRGLGWHIITDGVGPVGIRVFSLLMQSVNMQGFSLPANPNQMDVYLAQAGQPGDHHIRGVLSITSLNQYDEIIIEAEEPIKATGTAAVTNPEEVPGWAPLEIGWVEAEETAYKAADDTGRASEMFNRVFQYFRVPKTFNWFGWTPYVDNWGNVDPTVQGPYWNHDVAFLRSLPFLEEPAIDDAEPDTLEPLGLIRKPDDPNVWLRTDKLSAYNQSYKALTLKMVDREAAVFLSAESANHVLAKNHWEGSDPEPASSAVQPQFDYENFIVTVQRETEAMLRIKIPLMGNGVGSATGKQIYFSIPGVEVWVVAPGTVIGVDETGTPIFYDGPALLRDDSEFLRAIAVLTWVWFGQQRAAAQFTISNQLPWFQLGTLVRMVANGLMFTEVGTCVTKITRDYQTGEQIVETGYGELDIKSFGEAF